MPPALGRRARPSVPVIENPRAASLTTAPPFAGVTDASMAQGRHLMPTRSWRGLSASAAWSTFVSGGPRRPWYCSDATRAAKMAPRRRRVLHAVCTHIVSFCGRDRRAVSCLSVLAVAGFVVTSGACTYCVMVLFYTSIAVHVPSHTSGADETAARACGARVRRARAFDHDLT